jgi:hypothetical protein
VTAARTVLGPRLHSVIAYGSCVTGDVLPGYSDFDCLIVAGGPVTLADVLDLQQALGAADPEPFSYYQPTFVRGALRRASLVPGSFAALTGGEPPAAWVCRPGDLAASGERWLADLPAILAGDAADWSLATASQIARRARLHLTRVKPTLRALLTRAGADPARAWTATWADLEHRITALDGDLGGLVSALLRRARDHQDDELAVTALRLLARVCERHLGVAPGGQFTVC